MEEKLSYSNMVLSVVVNIIVLLIIDQTEANVIIIIIWFYLRNFQDPSSIIFFNFKTGILEVFEYSSVRLTLSANKQVAIMLIMISWLLNFL